MISNSVRPALSSSVVDRFLGMPPHPAKCRATYVWIDGTGEHVRSKTRTLTRPPSGVEDYPPWSYDGTSTGQVPKGGRDSDLILRPVAAYPDPLSSGASNDRLVLCETYTSDGKPTATNFRASCAEAMRACAAERPWFGLEQEYLLLDHDGHPLGWPKGGFPAPQGPYYCSVGADRAFGREVVDAHYRACLNAELDICGTNAEVTPGQWEFQIGPCEGVAAADQLWMARFLLHRVAEQFGVRVTFDPRPPVTAIGEWNAAGCHTNFSTQRMRDEGGMAAIEAAMSRLATRHASHLRVYDPHDGRDNLRRLRADGRFETSSVDAFTWGVADRAASVRVSRQVAEAGRGYLEDRRPASNCDPYRVSEAIVRTTVLLHADDE